MGGDADYANLIQGSNLHINDQQFEIVCNKQASEEELRRVEPALNGN